MSDSQVVGLMTEIPGNCQASSPKVYRFFSVESVVI